MYSDEIILKKFDLYFYVFYFFIMGISFGIALTIGLVK